MTSPTVSLRAKSSSGRSVVKELMENSLDARHQDCRRCRGGRQTAGSCDGRRRRMSPDDALACFGRHATSKLYEPDDLFSIKTLGFRGEALPSIASVSRLTLETQATARPESPLISPAEDFCRNANRPSPAGRRSRSKSFLQCPGPPQNSCARSRMS